MRKIILIIFSLFASVVLASGVSAEATSNLETKPEFNPICWQKEECDAARRDTQGGSIETGWVEKEEPCNKSGWGMCLPMGETKTTIAFGGKSSFANLGEFLKHNYNLALTIAGILAAIVTIISGIQWATSGGNSEMINSSKKRIGGAVIGLLIAYLSYAILNTINPALVNLRLPRAWLVRPQVLASEFCGDTKGQTEFMLAAPKNTKISEDIYAKPDFKKLDPSAFMCGDQYLFNGGGSQVCYGKKCTPKTQGQSEVCARIGGKYDCVKAVLAGGITGNVGITKASEKGDNVELIMMCSNGEIYEVEDVDTDGKSFIFGADDPVALKAEIAELVKECEGDNDFNKNTVVGFYIGLEINDQSGGPGKAVPVGYNPEGGIGTSGIDDWHAIGVSSPGDCSLNLAKTMLNTLRDDAKINFDGGLLKQFAESGASCSLLSIKEQNAKAVQYKSFTDHLISLDQLVAGYTCNIKIDRNNFPPITQETLSTILKQWWDKSVFLMAADVVFPPLGFWSAATNADNTDCYLFSRTLGLWQQ